MDITIALQQLAPFATALAAHVLLLALRHVSPAFRAITIFLRSAIAHVLQHTSKMSPSARFVTLPATLAKVARLLVSPVTLEST